MLNPLKKSMAGFWLTWRQLWQGLLYAGPPRQLGSGDTGTRRRAYLAHLECRYRQVSRGGMRCC